MLQVGASHDVHKTGRFLERETFKGEKHTIIRVQDSLAIVLQWLEVRDNCHNENSGENVYIVVRTKDVHTKQQRLLNRH